MVKRIVLVGGVAWLMAGCSLFGEVAPGTQAGYFEPRTVADQDPYWERFYALEQEIARLKAKLNDSEEPPESKSMLMPADQSDVADEFLARLRQKADKAVLAIDQAIASLDQSPVEQPPQPVVEAHDSPQIAIAGAVQRGEQGDVVGQVTRTQSRQAAYNYSLVYVYQEPQPWNEMWERLEQANEQDKWRGSNPAKPSYFIYVGAYYRESDARERHDSLMALLGEGPEMRANVQSSALASN